MRRHRNLGSVIALSLAVLIPAATTAQTVEARDTFGVTQLYQTKSGGMNWASKWNNGHARTLTWGADPDDAWFQAKGDATYKIDGKGLMSVTGSTPRSYIISPTQQGWTNAEFTIYAKRVLDTSPAWGGIVGALRTNHQDDIGKPCDTRGILGRFRINGHIDFEKETKHPASTAIADRTYWSNGFPKNMWIGYKYVVYDLPNNKVKLELYMDKTDGLNGGQWVLVNQFTDDGTNFGKGGTSCKSGVSPLLPLTASNSRLGSETGKPNASVYFRSDNVGTNGLVYKKVSVREINPIRVNQ